jgi:hypothetical protein
LLRCLRRRDRRTQHQRKTTRCQIVNCH